MGNPQRILILWMLAEKERTVTEIAEAIGASMPSTSHHLRILEFSQMVKTRREHQNVFYHLIDNDLVNNCPVLASRLKVPMNGTSPLIIQNPINTN